MPSKSFKPGDRVVWWKQTPAGDHVFPVLSTVLAVNDKRVKIEAEDEDGKVIRHVLPRSIEHHVSSPKSVKKPSQVSATRQAKRSGKEPTSGRSKRSGQLVASSGRTSRPEKDDVREDRITMEIVVDAYDEGQRALG